MGAMSCRSSMAARCGCSICSRRGAGSRGNSGRPACRGPPRPHDVARFVDERVVLPSGGREAADFDCCRGSVVADDEGVLHLFNTGHNPDMRTPDGDLQVVCHATSNAGPGSWVKHPEWTFGALDGCAPEDWRDQFVFCASPGEPWQMLLAARRPGRSPRRSGVVARLVWDDLVLARRPAVVGSAPVQNPGVPRPVPVGMLVVPRPFGVLRLVPDLLPDRRMPGRTVASPPARHDRRPDLLPG